MVFERKEEKLSAGDPRHLRSTSAKTTLVGLASSREQFRKKKVRDCNGRPLELARRLNRCREPCFCAAAGAGDYGFTVRLHMVDSSRRLFSWMKSDIRSLCLSLSCDRWFFAIPHACRAAVPRAETLKGVGGREKSLLSDQ